MAGVGETELEGETETLCLRVGVTLRLIVTLCGTLDLVSHLGKETLWV